MARVPEIYRDEKGEYRFRVLGANGEFVAGWRATRPPPPFRKFKLHGPAVPEEFDKVFGAYGQGGVEGLIVLQNGIRVGYYDGTSMLFVPLPDGATLYWKDGQPEVVPADAE